MKKRMILMCVAFTALTACLVAAYYLLKEDSNFAAAVAIKIPVNADAPSDSDKKPEDIPESIDDLLAELDLGNIQSIVDELNSDQIRIFGFGDIVERLRAVANDKDTTNIGGMISYIFSLFGADAVKFLPMLLSIVAIVIAYSIINSLKSGKSSESIGKVVYFATGAVAICLVVGYFASVISTAVKYTASLKTQINSVAPALLTLMTAAGASSTAGVYGPTVALLGGAMTNAITYVVFPMLLMSLVFDIVGAVATSVKLDRTADFFRSCCKWLLGTAFFIFMAVMGVSGITASVRDGISVRAARFAVSQYVPVIGGYLSQGFDYILAGNVLIKNALGQSAVVLIVLYAAPVISQIVVFDLMLRLTAAIVEPLGGEKFGSLLTSIAKSASMIATVVVAMTFLYILFLTMTISTGNIAL